MSPIRLASLLAVAGLATSASAGIFDSDSVDVTGQIAADTQIDATFVGLLDISLDGLDVAPTDITGGGTAQVNALTGANLLSLTDLDLAIDDIIVPPFGDSDSASIFVAGIEVDIDVFQFDITNIQIEITAPTNSVAFVGESEVTFTDVQTRIIADVAVNLNADLQGTGLASAIEFALPLNEMFSFDQELTLPSLTFDSDLTDDVLTLSSAIDVQDFLPGLDDAVNGALGTSLDLVNDSGNFDISNDEIQALIDAVNAEAPGTIPTDVTDLLGLVSLSLSTNSIVATTAFTATFTIPAPGAGLLAVAGIATTVRRRRG
ncbi:MAG: hypothetical protein AAGI30_10420 [Planctomycetota bacterium]